MGIAAADMRLTDGNCCRSDQSPLSVRLLEQSIQTYTGTLADAGPR